MLSPEILSVLETGRPLRSGDLAAMGVSRTRLARLTRSGTLVREGLLYSLAASAGPTPGQRLAKMHPTGVLCLLTAQKLHDLTDNVEAYGVIALRRGAWIPDDKEPDRYITWQNPLFFTLGVEKQDLGGVPAFVTDRWRTVADMFRPHHRQDLDEALKALGAVARDDGVSGLTKVSNYAFKLGFGQHVIPRIQALKELTPCAIPKR